MDKFCTNCQKSAPYPEGWTKRLTSNRRKPWIERCPNCVKRAESVRKEQIKEVADVSQRA